MKQIRSFFIADHLSRAEDSFEAAKIRLSFSFFVAFLAVSAAFIPFLFTYRIPAFTYINLGFYPLYMLPFVLLKFCRSYEIPSFIFAVSMVLSASANSIFNNGLLTPNISVWYFIAVAFGAYTLRLRYTISLVVFLYACLSVIDWLKYTDRLFINPYFSEKANLNATPFIMAATFPLMLKLLIEYVRSKKEAVSSLKAIIREKDDILGVVAHDLRNPVGAAVSCIELVGRDIEKGKYDEARRFLGLAESSCRRALGHIEELIEVTVLKEDSRPLGMTEEDIGPFLKSIVDAHAPRAEVKRIDLRFEAPDRPISLPFNKPRFSRVMDNVISNAIKFTGEGGRIDVDTRRVGGDVIIRVADTGIGIPAALQTTLFDKFTPAARKGTADERSTGLGMSITKQIVELHGGTIRFETEEGKGTVFYIQIPLDPGTQSRN